MLVLLTVFRVEGLGRFSRDSVESFTFSQGPFGSVATGPKRFRV